MTDDRSAIHKQVFRLAEAADGRLVQLFEVPRTAELVAIDWDTRETNGIALWYLVHLPHEAYTGPEYTTTWRVMVCGTGDVFLHSIRHLATLVRDGFAWHLFDADGDNIRRAKR